MGLLAESVASAISAIEAGALSISGVKTFTTSPVVPDATTSAQAASYGNVLSAVDAIPAQVGLGAWDAGAPWVVNTSYLAATDGFVVGYSDGSNGLIKGYTNGSNPPTTQRWGQSYTTSICMPVKKSDYWKITISAGTPTIFWIPLGS
jgi:hypothetical protein